MTTTNSTSMKFYLIRKSTFTETGRFIKASSMDEAESMLWENGYDMEDGYFLTTESPSNVAFTRREITYLQSLKN